MRRWIRNMILQIAIFLTVFTSATPSSLEVLFESNIAAKPSWSYTLFPSNFPMSWRVAAELCESIPGAVMAKVRNEETVKVMLRFLQLSGHSSPVWIRNRQTITEVLSRERSDVPSLSGYSERNQTFLYPDKGKAGLTLRCSLIRPETGISDELCNNLSAFGAICIQPNKSPRPYHDVCPALQNRPWVFLWRYKKTPSGKSKHYLTSYSMCKGSLMSFVECKCHPKKGWLDVSSCPEADKSAVNVKYKQQPERWEHLRQTKIKAENPMSKDFKNSLTHRSVFSHNERFKRSDHPDSIELIEQIMRNLTAEQKEKQKYDTHTMNANNPKNVTFSINVHGNSSNSGNNAINIEKTLPYHLQLNQDDTSIINLKENEIPKIETKLPDKIYLLAEEIVNYLNYSSGENQADTISVEYLNSSPPSLNNNKKPAMKDNVDLGVKYMKVNESTASNPRFKWLNDDNPDGPKIRSSLRKDKARIAAALKRSSSENATIQLCNSDKTTTDIRFTSPVEMKIDKHNKSRITNITEKISKDNLFLSKLTEKSESIEIANDTILLEKDKMHNQTLSSQNSSAMNVNVTSNDNLHDYHEFHNKSQNSSTNEGTGGFEVFNKTVIGQSKDETQKTKTAFNATVPMINPSSNKKVGPTKKTILDFILGKLFK